MFLKKSVKDNCLEQVNLLKMIEGATANDTNKDLVDMAPEKSSIMISILAGVPIVSTVEMETYVLEHQDIYSRLMKADRQEMTEASTHHANMTRLLDCLSQEQQLTMNYQMSSWEDRSKASAEEEFKVGLKLTKYLGQSTSILGAAAVAGNLKAKLKNNDDKCPKYPYLYHQWSKCDLNPDTTDVSLVETNVNKLV